MRYSTLEKILKTRFNLIGIETQNSASILDSFKLYHSTTGKPVYKWKQDIGLYRIDLAHVKIPNTSSIEQVFNFIQKDKQQSIFIFSGFAQKISNIFVEKSLINICQPLSQKHQSRLIIIDEELNFSIKFRGIVLETKKMLKMKLKRAA